MKITYDVRTQEFMDTLDKLSEEYQLPYWEQDHIIFYARIEKLRQLWLEENK